MELRTYIVTYDISSPKRWREVFRTMHGFGEHIQLSVFRCDLTALQRARMASALDAVIHHHEDQVLVVDLGKTTEKVIAGIEVLGRPQIFHLPATRII